jgi:hypothetical protein
VKEHDVLRLHVPVGDAVEMQMFHSTWEREIYIPATP